MKRSLFALLIFGSVAQAGNVLMIDLNNSTHEVEGCIKGVMENNQKTGGNDSVYVVGGGQRVTAQTVDAYVDEQAKKGVTFDTVVISGHDGSGDFFGNDPGNHFLATDLKNIFNKHPELRASCTGMALWGCYTGNVNASENFWMKKVSPNIKATVGFTMQSPDNTRPGNWALLQDYCSKRGEIAAAQNKEDIERSFNSLNNARNWNVGVCYKDGVCSPDYNKVGEAPKSCFHSYDELHARCQEFDPGAKQLQMFESYMAARDPAYANPPPDGEDEFTSQGLGASPVTKGPLRKFYGQLHLWRHCSDQLKTEDGYQMPLPAQVIRLTKFETLKKNFAHIEKPQIDQYNSLLQQVGLGQYALSDINHMTRAQIVGNIQNAESGLARFGSSNGAGVDPAKLLVMAQGFDRSLKQLDWVCTDFTYVHDNATKPSPCVAPYGRTPQWQGR